ncbi:MAG: asparaginase [Alphaproteobacteria bacterium]|nr:asparaginase [Alphaproteobacteria bacterium]HPF45658.1 asparaginase [Emcibacteraceae bacterium]HRW30593.1 asparaginase [Emcibacteraceae bacterium]
MDKMLSISVVLLGGTISMAPSKNEKGNSGEGVVPSITADELCNAVPGIEKIASVKPKCIKLIASANLDIMDVILLKKIIEELAEKDISDGVVIIQGTDTMEEMAFALDLMLDVKIPVIFTGAMRSANMVSADGPSNILGAVIAATYKPLANSGVVVLMNDEIHAARFVQKCHTRDVGAFKSLNGGKVGQICEGKVLLSAPVKKKQSFQIVNAHPVPKVGLIKATLGDPGDLLEYYISENYQGLVIEAFGAGHLPEKWLPLLDRVIAKMPVILCSRTAEGPVFENSYGYPGAEIDLIARGLVPAGILDGPKARLYLMISIMAGQEICKPDY